MTSRHCSAVATAAVHAARINKCQRQNADPIDLFRRYTMDLEFNIQGRGLYKSWVGLKMRNSNTNVVWWGCLWIKFWLIPQWCLLLEIIRVFYQPRRGMVIRKVECFRALRYHRIGIKIMRLLEKSIVSVSYQYRNLWIGKYHISISFEISMVSISPFKMAD